MSRGNRLRFRWILWALSGFAVMAPGAELPVPTPSPTNAVAHSAEAPFGVKLLGTLFQITQSLEDHFARKDLSLVHHEDAMVGAIFLGFNQPTNLVLLAALVDTNAFRLRLGALQSAVSQMHRAADRSDSAQVEAFLPLVKESFESLKALFPSGIVADARGLAERYMCPMHPREVGARTGVCSKCSMELDQRVRLWPFPQGASRWLQSTIKMWARVGEPLTVGQRANVELLLQNEFGIPVKTNDLIETHTERIHLLINDSSLEDYHHEHPRPTGVPGVYSFSFTPRNPGSYRLWADLRPTPGGIQEYAIVDLPATTGGLPITNREVRYKTQVGGLDYEVEFASSRIRVGYPVSAKLRITRSDGTGFTELEPIMATFAHVVGFNDDYKTVLHMHPKGKPITNPAARGGPELEFQLYASQPGFIRLFAQVQIGGVSRFAPFGIQVLP